MASRIEGYDEKIIACAKEEFLKKGYADASLRTIAQNADVSTSTIYTRYLDKEGLFRFLVEPVAKGLKHCQQVSSLKKWQSILTKDLRKLSHIFTNISMNLSSWLQERQETIIRNFWKV